MELETIYSFIGVFSSGIAIKWVWDRFLSKKSRVTQESCDLLRKELKSEATDFAESCVSEMKTSILEMKNDLKDMKKKMDDGDEYFRRLNKFQTIFATIMLQICEKEKIDCSDIRKAMYEEGFLK